jgi:dienelactone hydrolase
MAQGPHEMPFVVETSTAGTVTEHDDFDVYRPAGDQLPVVIFVPGPVPADFPVRPRKWPLFTGYGQLLASRGVVAVVLDQPYHSPTQGRQVAEAVPGLVEAARALDGVDGDRVAVWAFSGGGLLVGRWLAESPPWLRCLALTYTLLAAEIVRPGRPLVLTTVGQERPELQATVDKFLTAAADVDMHVIDVPNGHHGFDVADHTEESRHAVLEATDFVVGQLM